MTGLSRDFAAPSHGLKIETRSVATPEKVSDINIHHEQDDDDLEFPTDKETKTLLRVPDTIPLNTYIIVYLPVYKKSSSIHSIV